MVSNEFQSVQRAIQLNPNAVRAYVELANLSQARGDIGQAIREYEKLLAVNSSLAPIQVVVGNLYFKKKDLKSARRSYEAALME